MKLELFLYPLLFISEWDIDIQEKAFPSVIQFLGS